MHDLMTSANVALNRANFSLRADDQIWLLLQQQILHLKGRRVSAIRRGTANTPRIALVRPKFSTTCGQPNMARTTTTDIARTRSSCKQNL